MELSKMHEVMESQGVIEVLHNGEPVWVESVSGDIANVRYLLDETLAQVPVSELEESDLPPRDLMEEFLDGTMREISPY
jgi:small acid-soluble spore protein H (minor)